MAPLLLILSACLAGASAAAMGYSDSISSSDGMESSGMNGDSMEKGSSTSTTETLANGDIVSITVGVSIISQGMGGTSGTTQVSSPSTTAGQTHQVTVGGAAGLVYSPDSVEAAVGDIIQFNFMSQNHTVTQSTFAEPCVALAGGIDSSFMPNPNNTVNPPPSMMVQVTSAGPYWFYCKQKGHCGKGMTFSVNPTANKTQATFMAMAIAQNGTATDVTSTATATATTMTMAAAAASPAASTAAMGSSSPSTVQGSGSVSSGGECSCSCLCGTNAFPPMDGIGNFGGLGGSMPMSSISG